MLLAGQQRFPCSDATEMEHSLRLRAGATMFEAGTCAHDFQFDVNMAQMSSIALIWSTCNIATTIRYSSAGYVRQIFPIDQPISIALDDSAVLNRINDVAYLVPSAMDWQLQNGADFESLALRVETSALEGCLEAMIGTDCRGRLQFEGGEAGDPRLTRILRNAVFQFAHEIDLVRASFSTVALRELEQSLVLKFLLCNPHNYSHILKRAPSHREETKVRRAEEYIAANWNQPFDVRTLAAVSETSERSLHRAFQKRHGVSPYAFVKRLRLERARAMLLQGTDVTVVAVALKCNFHSLGRFSADYRRVFGELPSQTVLSMRSLRSSRKSSARGRE